MDETVRSFQHPDFLVTAIVARWRPASATLSWVNCGAPAAYVVGVDGTLDALEGPVHPALGSGDEQASAYTVSTRRLRSGERLILPTDGITERGMEGGGRFGLDGLRRAVEDAAHPTATGTARAIQEAVTHCWSEPFEDDATVVVMAVA
jgi:serine phosphatase RsbU (regulator of sigma subunit)